MTFVTVFRVFEGGEALDTTGAERSRTRLGRVAGIWIPRECTDRMTGNSEFNALAIGRLRPAFPPSLLL